MRVFVAGDNEAINAQVQAVVARNDLECLATDVASLDNAAQAVAFARRDLTVFIMPPDSNRGLAVLRELRGATQQPVLVAGPADNPKLILQILREGADEYLDKDDLGAELETALARLKLKRQASTCDGKVIGVLAASGGAGSSTVAANLAAALAQDVDHTALFDMRLRCGDQTLLFDLKPTHTLADLCRSRERMDQSMLQQSLVRHQSGVQLLAAPSSVHDIPAVTPSGVRQTLSMARALMPFVVLDLDRTLGPEQVAAVVQADTVLLVLRLDIVSLHNTSRTLEHLDKLGITAERVRLVVNRYRQPKELPVRKAEQVLGIKFFHLVPDDPARVNSSINNGVPVVIESPRAKISRNIMELANRVKDLHKAHHGNGHGRVERLFPEGASATHRQQ